MISLGNAARSIIWGKEPDAENKIFGISISRLTESGLYASQQRSEA